MVRKALAVLAVAGAALWVVGLLQSAPVEATSHGAVRSFSATSVLPGGRLEVTIVLTGYGSLGQVVETLPDGFAYAGSDLSKSQVAVVGQTITVTLLGETTFAYTVTAPAAAGSYVFSGIAKDEDKAEASVFGTSSIRVGPPPTPRWTPRPAVSPCESPGRSCRPSARSCRESSGRARSVPAAALTPLSPKSAT